MNDRAVDASVPISHKAARLVEYIQSHDTFALVEPTPDFTHMGGLITDASLQAGLRYDTVVWPRVQRVIAAYPEDAATTSGFLKVLTERGPETVLNWTHPEKLNRVLAAATFFQLEGVETVSDLRTWLLDPDHITQLKKLRGIGDKTADYYRLLVGLPAVAIDRHLYNFLAEAGVPAKDYAEACQVIYAAAELMQVDPAILDHSIWRYMSTRKAEKRS